MATQYLALNYWVMGGLEGELPAGKAIQRAKEYGLDGVELTYGDLITEQTSDNELSEIKEHANSEGIGLKTMASGVYWGLSLSSEDADERKHAVEFSHKYIETAAKLGAESVLIIPGFVERPWEESPIVPYDVVWENSIASLKEIIPVAESNNVNIALENVWNNFHLSPMDMKFYLENFDSQKIGVYFDVGNVMRTGYPEHWIRILGKNIKAVHVKNYSRGDACGGLHGFGDDLLEGDVNYSEVKKALADTGYNGPITAEMIPFCRLPDMVLPDEELAKDTAVKLQQIFRG